MDRDTISRTGKPGRRSFALRPGHAAGKPGPRRFVLRSAQAAAAQALVSGGALLTVAALIGPASWRQGEAHAKPAVAVLVTIFLLAPALSAACAAMTRLRPPRRIAAVAGSGALLAAVVAAASAAGEATLDGLAAGGPLAAVGAALSAMGWLVAALTSGAASGRGGAEPAVEPPPNSTAVPGQISWGPLASATVLVLLLGWLGPAAVHRLARTGVDARTASRPFAAAAVPAGLGDRWRASVPGTVVDVSAGLVLLRDKAGVRTVDAASGRAAWRYLRAGASLAGLGPAAGGRIVVGLWRGDGVTRAIGFDAATGSRRWDRRLDVSTVDYEVVGSGSLAVLVPHGAGAVVALDASTGRQRWAWKPANASCRVMAGAASSEPARDDAVAIAFSCPDGRRVAGLSTGDGVVRWTWAPATGSDSGAEPPPRGTAPGGSVPSGFGPLLVGTTGGVLVNDGDTGLVLSLASGRAGAIHPAGGRLASAVDTSALYLGSGGAVAVDLALGRERWRTPLPAATTPVAATGLGGAGYGLVVPDRGGAARVLRYDVSTGAVTAERLVDDAAVRLWVGPGVLVLATSAGDLFGLG
jgi:outer membrane protein assembly factor BamB